MTFGEIFSCSVACFILFIRAVVNMKHKQKNVSRRCFAICFLDTIFLIVAATTGSSFVTYFFYLLLITTAIYIFVLLPKQ
jgi:hypothetical protein